MPNDMPKNDVNITPAEALNIAAERLSIVRYVFLVQIEDGIALSLIHI